jgi:hypothetical protein
MRRMISVILGMLSGYCGAVFAIEYAIPATSITELTRADVPLWERILVMALLWALSIGAIYMSIRLLKINDVGAKAK